MNKNTIITDLRELDTVLHLTRVAVDKGYLSAAISYLDDIESEAIRVRKQIEKARIETPKTWQNFLNPNDPAFVPEEVE
jgi:hypothetical protein